jgi:hypothetical protein
LFKTIGQACIDMLNFYRRTKNHALNIAEVVAGDK